MPLPTSFMAVKKKPSRSSSTDELAVVKSAAWAWYQRGSASEAKPIGELDVARTHRVVYKPSRYKLEAMKISEEQEEANNNNNNNNSLLDTYEIESISKRFDQLINSSTNTDDEMMKKKVKKSRGFWMRRAVACGTSKDVVVEDARLYASVSRRRPPVVKLSTCSPRVTHA